MEDLIKALQIFLKYGNPRNPCYCNNEELYIDIDPKLVSDEDKEELKKLKFYPASYRMFVSYRFGSC